MKILCPVDFSDASLNAFDYALKLGDFLGASLVEVTHCHYVKPGRKVGEDPDKESLLRDKLVQLREAHQRNHQFTIETSLFKGHPLDVLAPYLKAMGHDLIVVGTKGLTPVRDLTIGSFTEDLIFSLECPILVVPITYQFRGLANIVLAIDSQPISSSSTIQILAEIVTKIAAKLQIVHVHQDQGTVVDKLTSVDRYFDHINYDFQSVPVKESVTKTIDQFCQRQKADMLCMVHRDRAWMINIFHKSKVKEELFHLKTPLLVLIE